MEKIVKKALENMNQNQKKDFYGLLENYLKEKEENALRNRLKIGEKMLLEALEPVVGYSKEELNDLLIKFGDVGSVAEYTLKRKKQTTIASFFGDD